MNILLFARDPGGANTIIPLIKPLRSKGHETIIFGKDAALRKFLENEIEAKDITGTVSEINLAALHHFIEQQNPDFVITGTSADDNTEKYLWHVCTEAGIPALAIIDQWCNYGLRFSDYGIDKLQEYYQNKKHIWLPARIVTLDEFAKQEMIAQGLPGDRIVVCGQPHFELLISHMQSSGTGKVFPREKRFTIIFASEPISSSYGSNGLKSLGYNEKTIFRIFLDVLRRVLDETDTAVELIIRPHPKEDSLNLTDMLEGYNDIDWQIDTETRSWEIIQKADLVCGMSSMFLIEALILGRPIMSIQIGLCTEDPFIFSRRGIISSITQKKKLEENLRQAILYKSYSTALDFEFISNPVERIISVMEELTCRNLQ